jgi:hypothetical protein
MTHLRTMIFLALVAFLLGGVQYIEEICVDSTAVVKTPWWKPVESPLNKCMKGAERDEPVRRLVHD